MKYYLESMGCQMNTADSQHLASELEKLGHRATATLQEADIMVVNTCVVRQSAEDKAFSRLGEFNVLKQENPERIIAVMGCLVGVRMRFACVSVCLMLTCSCHPAIRSRWSNFCTAA